MPLIIFGGVVVLCLAQVVFILVSSRPSRQPSEHGYAPTARWKSVAIWLAAASVFAGLLALAWMI